MKYNRKCQRQKGLLFLLVAVILFLFSVVAKNQIALWNVCQYLLNLCARLTTVTILFCFQLNAKYEISNKNDERERERLRKKNKSIKYTIQYTYTVNRIWYKYEKKKTKKISCYTCATYGIYSKINCKQK